MNTNAPFALRVLVNFTSMLFAGLLMLTACGRRDEPKAPAGGSTNKPSPAAAQNTKKKPTVTNNQPADLAGMAVDPRIQGTWKWDEAGSVGSMTFNPDSTYYVLTTNQSPTGPKETSYEGKWGVKDGVLIFTYSKSSDPKVMPGRRIDRFKVVGVNAQELALSDLGQRVTNVLHRAN